MRRTLLLSLALAAAVCAAPVAAACNYDLAAMLELDVQAFDQDLSNGGGGWRKVANRAGCESDAADLIRAYRNRHGIEGGTLAWHEGQMRASAGDYAQAARLFDAARHGPDQDPFGWNHYVDASIAFLERDIDGLLAARKELAATAEPADPDFPPVIDGYITFPSQSGQPEMKFRWPPNLEVVDALVHCFDQSYRFAYGDPSCRQAPPSPSDGPAAAEPDTDASDSPAALADTLADFADDSRDRPGSDTAQAMHERYTAAYGDVLPKTLEDDDLMAMFESLAQVAFYLGEPAAARDLLTVTTELEHRSAATAEHLERTHAILVAARLLGEARIFHDLHPGLKARRVPEVEPTSLPATGNPGILVWDSGRGVLQHEAIELEADYQILVVSHPLCGFSKAAADAISDDPELARVFAHHATWAVAPPGNLPLGPIEQWQARHPDHRIGLIDRPEAWGFIETGNTPVFYFLQAGNVVESVSGWPEGGNREAVVAALRRIGALRPR